MPGHSRGAAWAEDRARCGGVAAGSPPGPAGSGIRIAVVERAYRHSTRVLGGALFLLGVALVVSTLARGGGPLAVGVIVGLLFALLGAGRVWLATRPDSPRGRT